MVKAVWMPSKRKELRPSRLDAEAGTPRPVVGVCSSLTPIRTARLATTGVCIGWEGDLAAASCEAMGAERAVTRGEGHRGGDIRRAAAATAATASGDDWASLSRGDSRVFSPSSGDLSPKVAGDSGAGGGLKALSRISSAVGRRSPGLLASAPLGTSQAPKAPGRVSERGSGGASLEADAGERGGAALPLTGEGQLSTAAVGGCRCGVSRPAVLFEGVGEEAVERLSGVKTPLALGGVEPGEMARIIRPSTVSFVKRGRGVGDSPSPLQLSLEERVSESETPSGNRRPTSSAWRAFR